MSGGERLTCELAEKGGEECAEEESSRSASAEDGKDDVAFKTDWICAPEYCHCVWQKQRWTDALQCTADAEHDGPGDEAEASYHGPETEP